MSERHCILWRRLDAPGHDACRVSSRDSGCEIEGTAVFLHNGAPARLSYRLSCDRVWRTVRGGVQGFVGQQAVDVTIERAMNGTWTVDGRLTPGLEDCVHLDFAFTPATNLPQLRQLALAVGEAADVPVAWLDVPPAALQVLPQRYERRGGSTCWYEAPTAGYAGLLELTPSGLVSRYPGLWERENPR